MWQFFVLHTIECRQGVDYPESHPFSISSLDFFRKTENFSTYLYTLFTNYTGIIRHLISGLFFSRTIWSTMLNSMIEYEEKYAVQIRFYFCSFVDAARFVENAIR